MFSQLVFVRLKAAENALRDGKLDDAYRLATAADLRSHRRAGAVLATLAERYLERAREHFREDRFREALLDLDRAQVSGGPSEAIAELRSLVHTVASEQQRKEQARRNLLHDAARRIEVGSLAAGKQILDHAGQSDHAANELRRAVFRRSEEVATLAAQAERFLGLGQFAAASERIQRAKSIDAHAESVARLEAQLCRHILDQAKTALISGKLERCANELSALGILGSTLAAKRELHNALTMAQEAGRCVRASQFAEARRITLGLLRLFPDALWVQQSEEQLSRLEENVTSLAAGPLGETIHLPVGDADPLARPRAAQLDQTVALVTKPRLLQPSGDGYLLLVDGGGSYLLLRQDRMVIGRAAADHPAEIPILSDLAERHAELARMEDDYFLFASRDVEVAGKLTRHQLLRDGDRIVLGRKGKLTFRLPARQSPSAVLDLSDTTKMPNDVRRVVLFHQHALVGNSSAAHVFCRQAGPTLVLFERNGSLWIRTKSDGHSDNEAKALILGESVEMGGVRLAVEPWRMRDNSAT